VADGYGGLYSRDRGTAKVRERDRGVGGSKERDQSKRGLAKCEVSTTKTEKQKKIIGMGKLLQSREGKHGVGQMNRP